MKFFIAYLELIHHLNDLFDPNITVVDIAEKIDSLIRKLNYLRKNKGEWRYRIANVLIYARNAEYPSLSVAARLGNSKFHNIFTLGQRLMDNSHQSTLRKQTELQQTIGLLEALPRLESKSCIVELEDLDQFVKFLEQHLLSQTIVSDIPVGYFPKKDHKHTNPKRRLKTLGV